MLNITNEIIVKAAKRYGEAPSSEVYSFNWYVYDTYGIVMGFNSTDSLSVQVREELELLGLFDWRK